MKRQRAILLLLLILLLSLAGCRGKDTEETVSSAETTPAVKAVPEEDQNTGTDHYENMYFSLDLSEEDGLSVTEERSSEFYMTTVRDANGNMLAQIELTAKSRELTADQFYYGELYIEGDQGHLNMIVTKGTGASDEDIDRILSTMEPCGEFSIRKNE